MFARRYEWTVDVGPLRTRVRGVGVPGASSDVAGPRHNAPRRRPYRLDDFRDQVLGELDGLDHRTIVGNSLGAFVASAVAMADPDRVDSLVLEELPVPPRDAADTADTADTAPTTRAMPALALLAAGWLTRRRCDPP
ncbi:alpha/beta fold hydrolase [Kribbella sp. VKM Ac-2571]|uniref:alpha/beta fold hydrolase n=1 Tax=Kribbella sp. VKM Ac-2571 TaxID=2512222 RepID=UPI00105D272E|nr:alpha/beta fold hydrolase [Kribbella sp. VKM Ac-2571]